MPNAGDWAQDIKQRVQSYQDQAVISRERDAGLNQRRLDNKQRIAQDAADARNRQGYGWNQQEMDASLQMAEQSRQQQQQGLGMLNRQMDTSRQSAASNAMLAGGQQAQGLQTSLAGLARGGPVGALAARDGAAMGNALAGQQVLGQAQALRAQEAAQAANQYGSAAAEMRQGDAQARGVAQGAAEARANSYMTGMQQNEARSEFGEGLGANMYGAEMQAAANARSREEQARELAEKARRQAEDTDNQKAGADRALLGTAISFAGKYYRKYGGGIGQDGKSINSPTDSSQNSDDGKS